MPASWQEAELKAELQSGDDQKSRGTPDDSRRSQAASLHSQFIATTNSGEIWVGPLVGMPLPLLPLQILWVNLVTDGLPALALGAEPAERDIMRRPPYHPSENVFGRGLGRHILWVGILMALVALGTGHWYWSTGNTTWQTMVFMVVIISQLSHVLAIRSWHESTLRIGLLSNKPLLGAVALTLLLQLAVVYVPLLQRVFKTVPLSAADLALSLALGSMVFWAVELEKWFLRSIRRRSVDTQSSQQPAPDSQSASERIATRLAKSHTSVTHAFPSGFSAFRDKPNRRDLGPHI